MENLAKYELPLELAHFQAEELEERLENKWGSSSSALNNCTISQEVNMCKGGAVTPIMVVQSSNPCPQTISNYVCK